MLHTSLHTVLYGISEAGGLAGVSSDIQAGIASVSLPEQAYHVLREMILDNQLLPGQKLVVSDLASRLNMSRTPVREALVRLASEGLAETVPHRGMRVTVPTLQSIREVYEIIQGIEGQAVKLAAERAGPDMIRRLEESVIAQEAALESGDLKAWAQADWLFHRLIIEATGNQHMREIMRHYDGQMQRLRLAQVLLGRDHHQSVLDHRAVLEAIRAADGNLARDIHQRHRDRFVEQLERIATGMMSMVFADARERSLRDDVTGGEERATASY